MSRRVKLAPARRFAERVLEELAPACEKIAIAGSIRRQVAEVKDAEIVAAPRGIPRDLLGDVVVDGPNDLDVLVSRLIANGRLAPRLVGALRRTRMGQRFKALESSDGMLGVDLFIVLPPASWGAIMAIRTGPAAYSKRLVMSARDQGLRCVDGRLVRGPGHDLAPYLVTPTERDFIRACGMPWLDPWDRFE